MKTFTPLRLLSSVVCTVLLALSLGTAHAQNQRPPVPAKKRYWLIQQTPQHIYRAINLNYYGVISEEDVQEITIFKLTPIVGLGDPMTYEECRESAKALTSDYFDITRDQFWNTERLWVDWDEAVIGLQKGKQVMFQRTVCLPMNLVDDLDIVGLKYRNVSFVGQSEGHDRDIKNGYDLVVKRGDIRLNFRYDPKRFFERFEAYNVTPKFKVPDTKDREGWEKPDWNTVIKIFPLGDAVDLTASRKK